MGIGWGMDGNGMDWDCFGLDELEELIELYV